MESAPLVDCAAGRRRSPATPPGYHRGRPPRNKGLRYPPDPPTIEEIIAVMRAAGDGPDRVRLRGVIVVLWRAGLRVTEALALAESDLDRVRGPIQVRHGNGGRRREVGMDRWAWEALDPWLTLRAGLPISTLFCVLRGPTRGWPWPPLGSVFSCATLRSRPVCVAGWRHIICRPHRYADQTRRRTVKRQLSGPKHRHNPAPFEARLGDRCEAANAVGGDRLDVWLRARDAVNRMRGSAFAARPVDRLTDAALVRIRPLRPTSRARRDRERRRVMPTPIRRSTQTVGTSSAASA